MSQPKTPRHTPRTPRLSKPMFYTPSHQYYTRWAQKLGVFDGEDLLSGIIKELHFQKSRTAPRPRAPARMDIDEEDAQYPDQGGYGAMGGDDWHIDEADLQTYVEELAKSGVDFMQGGAGVDAGVETPTRRVTRSQEMEGVEKEEMEEEEEEEEVHEMEDEFDGVHEAEEGGEEEEVEEEEEKEEEEVVKEEVKKEKEKKPARKSMFGWLWGSGSDEKEAEEEEEEEAVAAKEEEEEEEEEEEYEESEEGEEDDEVLESDDFIIVAVEEADAMQLMLDEKTERVEELEKELVEAKAANDESAEKYDTIEAQLGEAQSSVVRLEKELDEAKRSHKGELKKLAFEQKKASKAVETSHSDEIAALKKEFAEEKEGSEAQFAVREQALVDQYDGEIMELKRNHTIEVDELNEKVTQLEAGYVELEQKMQSAEEKMQKEMEKIEQEKNAIESSSIDLARSLEDTEKTVDDLREAMIKIHGLSDVDVPQQTGRNVRQKRK